MSHAVLRIPIRTLNRGKTARLEAMRAEFTGCVQFHLERIEATGMTNTTALHRDCYRAARERFRLPASTVQQARDQAIQARKSYLERKKRDRRAQPPTFRRGLPLRLAAENLRVFADRGMARVTTPDGFLWLPIVVPDAFRSDLARPHGVSEIVRKASRYFLMLVVKREDVPTRDDGPHFGIDLGLANIAVLSGPGVVKFFDGKPLRYVRGRYFRSRQALQQKGKTGMVKRSKGKEARWATDLNHQVSRAIVDLVAAHGGTLHVERLTGIRERAKGTAKVRRMLHSWPFAQLVQFIRYKAARAGVPVVEVDPRKTSQACSRCGHAERGNRTRQARFRCTACGFTIHADLNAARVIAAGGACFVGVGDVTAPVLDSSGRSGEAKMARKGRHRDNRNLESSA
jgi:IS605 OrfB family transposase